MFSKKHYLACESDNGKTYLSFNTCTNARTGGKEKQGGKIEVQGNDFYFRVVVEQGAICRFSFSTDGKNYQQLEEKFPARAGRCIGAKLGMFALKTKTTNDSGYADFDYFRFE